MSGLISRQAAIKAIDDLPNCYNGYSDTYDKAYIIGVLEEVPSVEPKKVVEDYCRPRNLMVVAAEDFHRLVEQMLKTIDVPDRKVGEWDMFELITSAYFGKQYYFVEENGLVYSRETHKYMTKDDAIREFLDIIGE